MVRICVCVCIQTLGDVQLLRGGVVGAKGSDLFWNANYGGAEGGGRSRHDPGGWLPPQVAASPARGVLSWRLTLMFWPVARHPCQRCRDYCVCVGRWRVEVTMYLARRPHPRHDGEQPPDLYGMPPAWINKSN